MKTALIFIFVLFLLPSLSSTQDSTGSDSSDASTADPSEQDADEAADAQSDANVRSQIEEWRETLLYGIESEVLNALEEIADARESLLYPEMLQVLKDTKNPEIRKKIFDYFTEQEYLEAVPFALVLVETADDYPASTVVAAVRYIEKSDASTAASILVPLVDNPSTDVARSAITALGNLNVVEQAGMLLEKFKDAEYPDELKESIILALGAMKSLEAVETLISVAEDTYAERVWRMYACNSLGLIGDPAAIPVLKQLFSGEDALIRWYAAQALAQFDDSEVFELLIQGLRDTNWRVRLEAARGLKERKPKEALAILRYKARKDPVEDVRVESVLAIGAIGGKEAFDFLRELYAEKRTPLAIRDSCLEVLLEKDLSATLPIIEEVVTSEWNAPYQKTLEITAKRLSLVKSAAVKDILIRFLQSPNLAVRLYGVRGIALNRFIGAVPELKRLSEEDPYPAVRREALSALEKLGSES